MNNGCWNCASRMSNEVCNNPGSPLYHQHAGHKCREWHPQTNCPREWMRRKPWPQIVLIADISLFVHLYTNISRMQNQNRVMSLIRIVKGAWTTGITYELYWFPDHCGCGDLYRSCWLVRRVHCGCMGIVRIIAFNAGSHRVSLRIVLEWDNSL